MKLVQLIFLTVLAIFAITILGCSHATPKPLRIGVSQCSTDEWREQMNEEMRREMLFHDDVNLEIRSANDDNAKQIADIRHFIDQKVDILIAAPNEAEAITPIIKEAYDAGIPVIIFDRNILGDSYTSYMELDNEGIGESAARYALHLLPSGGKVAEITGLPGSTPAQERHAGFRNVMRSHPEVQVVASVTGEWNGKKARHVVDSLLDRNPDINLIYAHNDIMAIAASEVARKKGLRNIRILGTDAAPELGIKAVADGVIDATFIYPTEGNRVIRTALNILKGQPFKRHDHIPALSTVDSTNAEILLRQNDLLKDETRKIEVLKTRNDELDMLDRTKTAFLWMAIIMAVLLALLVVLMLRSFKQRNKYSKVLAEKNSQLTAERDQKEDLYKRLDEVTRSQLQFYTNVSHDLRTPLTLISDPVEEVSKAEYLSAEHKILMNIARKNVRIMRRLINQILEFRKYENGKSDLMPAEVNLMSLIRDWTDSFKGVAQKREIAIKEDIPAGLDKTLAVDVEKMERVFFNLMSNAIKYTPAHGNVTVSCREDGQNFTIQVCDSGCGIDEADKERIFDRFFQSAQKRPNGSGIGLSVTKAFIELHGGTIAVDSTPGVGSCFTVTLPVNHVSNVNVVTLPVISEEELEAELGAENAQPRNVDNEKPLLLVVDDNADIRELMTELMADEYNVITADNGKTGVKLATKYVPDIIVCDIMMPVMDGLECCATIKREVSTSHIPVLMLTACKLDEQRLESYESGADGYLSKPFDRQLLKARCRNLIENRQRIKNLYQVENIDPAQKGDPLPEKTGGKEGENEFYKRFLEIVHKNYADSNLSSEAMGALLGLSAAQLSRKIKALTNLTPVELLRNYRLQLVRKLLISTDKTISEIAYEVGFSSPAYLSKCFRDHFNETPTDVREKMQ